MKHVPRILVIEDTFSDRILIAKTIRQLLSQAEITLMTSVAEALRGLLSNIIRADLIFLNYRQSPGLSAEEFLRCKRQISHLRDTATCVFMSTGDNSAYPVCMDLGAHKVIVAENPDFLCQQSIGGIIDDWLQLQTRQNRMMG